MKKHKKLLVLFSFMTVIMVVTAAYFAIGLYFGDNFYPGTYVNGVYCTGKSVEEINTELKTLYREEHFQDGEILLIKDSSGVRYEIELMNILFDIDYSGQLNALKEKQNPFLWIQGLTGAVGYNISPLVGYSQECLAEEVIQCGIRDNNRHSDSDEAGLVEIRMDGRYILFDGRVNVLDNEQVLNKVSSALDAGNYFVDVSDCYVNLPYTDPMRDTISLYKKVEAYQCCGITYDMGDEQIELTPEIVSGFIAVDNKGEFLLDEAGNLIWNEEAVATFVDSLCAKYDTYEKTHIFHTTRGEDITIEGGTYGTVLDREAEILYLTEALKTDKEEIHVPVYEREAYHRGANDIGTTYVEVDMTEQKLYYYEEGKLLIETDIVTGNMRRGWDTPEGVNYVYAMQRNRTLRGATYATFVKYWAPVVGNIGLHDASWRQEFGGDIYETSGSHGCINIPPDVMAQLYEYLEIGMPVVMFY